MPAASSATHDEEAKSNCQGTSTTDRKFVPGLFAGSDEPLEVGDEGVEKVDTKAAEADSLPWPDEVGASTSHHCFVTRRSRTC